MTGFDNLQYQVGFESFVSTEALPGSFPTLGNTPQRCPRGLVAELFSGASFTSSPNINKRSWFYRIRPSAADHGPWNREETSTFAVCDEPTVATPEQICWNPLPTQCSKEDLSECPTSWSQREGPNFVEGLICYCGAGDPSMKAGLRIHLYAFSREMHKEAFTSTDGHMLIIPQVGTLHIQTEMGKLVIPSGSIAVVPRGIRFRVCREDPSTSARGYVAEVFDAHFTLPPRGVIGTSGLANEYDFEVPVAAYDADWHSSNESTETLWRVYHKVNGTMWSYTQPHSPFDVVAWRGTYYPYRYDLSRFCVINSVSYDHLDPSTFAVLTAQTVESGTASCDFVIFPPRWMVTSNTFRPPYYHKNIMGEFMGNIRGQYEAKVGVGFQPGGATLHSCCSAHGPQVDVFEKASGYRHADGSEHTGEPTPQQPTPPDHTALAFMFESYYLLKLTERMSHWLQSSDYVTCWQGFKPRFTEK